MSYIPSPQIRCEEVLLSYISSSLSGSGLIDPSTNFYTGMAQEDVTGPAVVVAVNQADETYWRTRVFRFDTDITCKQIAYDSTTSSAVTGSIINLAGNIHSMFGDSQTASLGINQNTASGSNDFWVYQTQIKGYQSQRVEDAWISNLKLEVIGMLGTTTNFLPAIKIL